MYETRNLSIMLKLMSHDRDRADGGRRRRKHCKQEILWEYAVLNDHFEDILDTLGDSKEIGNDSEDDSESVSNTKVTYYACLFFYYLF